MLKENLFKHKTRKFIETGSFEGHGIDLALKSGFDLVYSIEISDHYYNFCVEKYKFEPRVKLIKGDSYIELEKLLSTQKEPFTYFLDGHYSGGQTGMGVEFYPIMKELESILCRQIDGEIIYVDDLRLIRNYSENINEDKILQLVRKYKPYAEIYFESNESEVNDILVIEY